MQFAGLCLIDEASRPSCRFSLKDTYLCLWSKYTSAFPSASARFWEIDWHVDATECLVQRSAIAYSKRVIKRSSLSVPSIDSSSGACGGQPVRLFGSELLTRSSAGSRYIDR